MVRRTVASASNAFPSNVAVTATETSVPSSLMVRGFTDSEMDVLGVSSSAISMFVNSTPPDENAACTPSAFAPSTAALSIGARVNAVVPTVAPAGMVMTFPSIAV